MFLWSLLNLESHHNDKIIATCFYKIDVLYLGHVIALDVNIHLLRVKFCLPLI